MDKGLKVPKWVLINWLKILQRPQNLTAQIVCPSPKVWIFYDKRFHSPWLTPWDVLKNIDKLVLLIDWSDIGLFLTPWSRKKVYYTPLNTSNNCCWILERTYKDSSFIKLVNKNWYLLSGLQLISEWNFGVFKSPKKPTKFLTDFCPSFIEQKSV